MRPDLASDHERYRLGLSLAVLLHVFLLSILFLTLRHAQSTRLASSTAVTVIHATTVESRQLAMAKPEETKNADQTSDTTITSKPDSNLVPTEKKIALKVPEKQPPLTKTVHTPVRTTSNSPTASNPPNNPPPHTTKKPSADKPTPHHSVSKPVKVSKIHAAPSPKLLGIAQKNVEKFLEQEVKSSVQKQQTDEQNTVLTEKYQHLILESIARQWIVPPQLSKDLETKLTVRLAPGGMVLEVAIVKSSGSAVLDRSAQTAVYKASPLPVPKNAMLFDIFRQINLTVRPEGVMRQ